MNCPNCHKKAPKGKIYCDDPVCKSDRATKRGLAQWSIRKQKLSTLAKNLTK